jgi:hypothetical protein
MKYQINEGSFTLPATAQDRSVNMLLLNYGPGGLSLVVTREEAQQDDDLDGFLTRQMRTLGTQVKELKQHARREVQVGPAQLPGLQITTSFKQNNARMHQLQTVFQPSPNLMLVLTLTSAAPLTQEQSLYGEQLLASFTPNAPACQ